MGAKVTWTETSVTITGPPRDASGRKVLQGIDVNMNKMPDVAMTLAVVALFANGPTSIRDGIVEGFFFFFFLQYRLVFTIVHTMVNKNSGCSSRES